MQKKTKFNSPIDINSFDFFKKSAIEFENYINCLKDCEGKPILKSPRKTGFLGLIICLQNVFELFKIISELGQEYLLTYKLSQDFLETFFSCVRSRGGFNNNPNAKQFETTYKRLLIRHEISNTYASNCLADGVEILTVSSKNKYLKDTVVDYDNIHCNSSSIDHDYISSFWSLTPFVENVVVYISGYIVQKMLKDKTLCNICATQLSTPEQHSLLINLKNRGKLVTPSPEVCRICLKAETIFRENLHIIFVKKNIKQYLITKIFASLYMPFNSNLMDEHILQQDIFDNHRSQLAKYIIEIFLNIRFYHETKTRNQKEENIRQKYTKLVLFKNQ